jgi:hypothetical protein
MKVKQMRDSDLFEKAVGRFFEPIARKLKLPLFKVDEGIYEIPSPHFIMRIRLHTGHSSSGRGLNVILRQTSLRDFVDNKPGFQLGIGCFRLFNGEELKPPCSCVLTDADFLQLAEWFAAEAEYLGVPYLLGLKDDFEAVQEFMAKRSEPEVQKIREMSARILRNMGGQVREEWPVVIPREKGEEGETAKELRESDIEYLGELEGQKERIFKEKLVELFKYDRSIKSAYLVRIIGYGIPATAALCLRTQSGSDKNMMEKMGNIFAAVFSIDESFNVIFLTEQQEPLIAKVCRPFFDEAAAVAGNS